MDNRIEIARDAIKKAHHVVFLGGAGVSTASGISDFRSPAGLYNVESKYGVPYETMLSHTYFEEHTAQFYDFYWSTMVSPKAKPNSAHLALAAYEKAGHDITIMTQNIDGLHQLAGNRHVIELHGSTLRYYCTRCAARFSLKDLKPEGVPHCLKCGGLLKPDVVLYEEPLDEKALFDAAEAMEGADLLIVGGTSMRVYPAAALPEYFRGSFIIMINQEETPFDGRCQLVFQEDIGKVLAEILT